MVNRFWREWRGLLIFLVVMVLFRSAIADWNQVPTGSMKPTILDGDRVIAPDRQHFKTMLEKSIARLEDKGIF